jgi:hypothetical protein
MPQKPRAACATYRLGKLPPVRRWFFLSFVFTGALFINSLGMMVLCVKNSMTLVSLFYINFNKESYVHCFVVEAGNFNFFFLKRNIACKWIYVKVLAIKHGFFSPMLGPTWAM